MSFQKAIHRRLDFGINANNDPIPSNSSTKKVSAAKTKACVSVLCLGMKNCYVTINLLVTRKNRLLHRKCFVRILFTILKTLETS